MALDNRSQMIESLEATGRQIMHEFENLIHEGNSRKITVTRGESTIVEVPLTLGVVGAVLAPSVAGLGAIAALATGCRIDVERTEPAPSSLAEDA